MATLCCVTSFTSINRDELHKFGNSVLEEVQIANQVERKESIFSKPAYFHIFNCSCSQPFQRKPHCCWSLSFSLSNARCSCLPLCLHTLLCPDTVAMSCAPHPFKATADLFSPPEQAKGGEGYKKSNVEAEGGCGLGTSGQSR